MSHGDFCLSKHLRIAAAQQRKPSAPPGEKLGDGHEGEALRAVLEDAIASLGQSQYRSLLTIVLGLDPEHERMTAGEKRRVAGQEFRRGERTVSAGTIRQYHEPKALDELAATLVSASSVSSGLSVGADEGQPVVKWHPHLRQRWAGESLVFWRLSLRAYRRPDSLQGIREAMHRAGVRAWSVYELFGPFDLMVRAWIPAGSIESDVRAGLLSEFGARVDLADGFGVNRVVSDWRWAARDGSLERPSPELLSRGLPASDVERLNRGDQDLDFKRYEALNLVRRPPKASGIGFFVALGFEGNALLRSGTRQGVEQGIVEVVNRASREGVSHLSIYEGSGFADFLVHGSVLPRDFSSLYPVLIQPLGELTPFENHRINTLIASSAPALAREEALSGGESPRRDERAVELLQQGESDHLEVKSAAFTALPSPEGKGTREEPRRSHLVIDALMTAIAAFLNADGGQVVIGASEKSAVKRRPRLAEHSIVAGAPAVGDYLVTGIDHESEGTDWYETGLFRLCKELIEPDPMPYLRVRFEEIDGRTLCVVGARGDEAAASGMWFYCKPRKGEVRFVVRIGTLCTALQGPDADEYKRANPRG